MNTFRILALAGAIICALVITFFVYAYPKMTLFNPNKVARNFSQMEQIFPATPIAAARNSVLFKKAPHPLPSMIVFAGTEMPLDQMLEETHTTSLIVIKDGQLVSETYRQGYDQNTRATSFSVAKSFVATMIGIALERGLIDDLNDKVTDYLPEMQNSGFANTRIIDLLQMSSGINFTEVYDDTSTDAFKIYDQMFIYLKSIDKIAASYGSATPPGESFYYASINTHVLSMILRRVSGQSLSDFLHETLWTPLGAEADAIWLSDMSGTEIGFWGLNALPRDFARLGLLMLADGVVDGNRLLPANWVHDATTPDKDYLRPGQIDDDWGYGYSWWLPRGGTDGDYSAIGIWGQFIYVNPTQQVVIVKTSSDPDFKAHEYPSIEVFRQISQSLR